MCGTALRFINQMHLSDKKAARLAVRQAGSGSWRRARTDRRLQQIVKITLKSVAVRKRKTFYCTGLAAQVARHRIFIFITAQHFRSVTNARNCPPNSDSISIFQSSHRIESAQIFLLCHLQSHSILRSPLDSSLYTFIQLINGPLLIRTAGYGLPPPPSLPALPRWQQRQFVCRQLGEFNFNSECGAAAGLNLPDWKLVTAVNPSTGNKHAMHVNGFTTQLQLGEKAAAQLSALFFIYCLYTYWGLGIRIP